MSGRINLSAHTYIEEMDGRRYLVTENLTISIDWPERSVEGACTNPSDGDWFELHRDEDWGASVIWRIPLTAAAPVYECRAGEPWLLGIEDPDDGSLMSLECGIGIEDYGWARYMHRRAAIVCDTAEQFKTLYDALKEARDRGTNG